MKWKPLTEKQKRVIVDAETEAAFSGEYDDFWKKGSYHCRRCGAKLYQSNHKFDARCGWPSFDDEVKNAIKRLADADGNRTQILCARCGAHLGHVFTGENLTTKNVRHCVNSVSLEFKKEENEKK